MCKNQKTILTDREIDVKTEHHYYIGKPVSRDYRISISRAIDNAIHDKHVPLTTLTDEEIRKLIVPGDYLTLGGLVKFARSVEQAVSGHTGPQQREARFAELEIALKNMQHQHKLSNDNELQQENGQLITSSSSVPAGWKLVPVEPTVKMVSEGSCAVTLPGPRYIDESASKKCWAYMLAAAPQPPGGQEPDWQDLYRKEKRRAEMWIAKYEKDIGKLEVAVPVAAQPQVEQEPVAWLKTWDSVGHAQTGMRRVDLTPECETWLANMFPAITPLYTHPQPPRQPLTVEQKAAVTRELNRARCLEKRVVGNVELTDRIASAIERAHEIGSGS